MLLSALVFGAAHFSARDFPQLVALGIVMGFAYVRSRNLATPMLIHGGAKMLRKLHSSSCCRQENNADRVHNQPFYGSRQAPGMALCYHCYLRSRRLALTFRSC